MSTLEVITLIISAIEFVALGVTYLSCFRLYRTLEKRFPDYYESIGKPKAYINFQYMPKPSEVSQRFKVERFALTLAGKGIPEDFPKDRNLRKQANLIASLIWVYIILFPVLMFLFIHLPD